MQIEKKYFTGLNADDDVHLLGETDYINAENIRWGTTDKGATSIIENVGSTIPLSAAMPTGSVCIGGAVERIGRYLVYFIYSPTLNSIRMWDIANATEYLLLDDTDVTGGLGFSKDKLIHSARIINDVLYWTDNLNEPRRMDIRAAANMITPATYPTVAPYTSPMTQSVLYWIRRQPGLPLTAVKGIDLTFENNFTDTEAFQFQYRYVYRGFELSALSAFSELVNYNRLGDTFNFITVTLPLGEAIDQDVIQIDLIAKYLTTGKSFIIKSWNKNIPADLTAINDHNTGTALSFAYYNDLIGLSLDDAYSVKPFDSVPIYAETIELARNRAFIANYTSGYDTPTETSLTAAASVQTGAGTLTGRFIVVRYNSGASLAYYFYLPDFNTFYSSGYTPPVSPVAFGLLSLVATGWGNFTAYVSTLYSGINSINWEGDIATVTGGPPVPGLAGDIAFKSGVTYQLSISFFDHAGRKSGILTKEELKVNIAEKIYAQVDYTTGIDWALSNVAALTEIPAWAYYYSINITKCLTTRFFLDSRTKNITYVTKDIAGVYVFNTSAWASTLNGVAIDITLLNSYSMGYTFTDGDLVKVYIGTDVFTLAVTGQEGNWIICELQNLGTLGNTATPKKDVLFEVFTPYKASTSEPHYEVGQLFKVDNPATGARVYSTLSGTIGGDITLLTRNDGTGDYLTENMSPSDKFYTRWHTDSGRFNFVETIGQVIRTNTIAFSDTFIQRTKVNGLSTFEALNVQDLPMDCGDIKKLQLASKVSEQGTVMLAICTRETSSIYLGEVQLVGAAANAFLAQSPGVIGSINTLKGSYGTKNPESVVFYKGYVFWFDVTAGAFIRYASNGLFPVSNYKLRRVAKLLADTFAATSAATIEGFGHRPFIFGGVDNYHGEILFAIPQMSATIPKGVLPDYTPDINYPYDIWDQQGKTLVFKDQIEGSDVGNRWMGAFTFSPEWMLTDGNQLYSFNNGRLWRHNETDSYNEFYDIQFTSKIMFASNVQPSRVKSYKSISVEANQVPVFTHIRSEDPFEQSSDVIPSDYTLAREGVYYAGLYRDRLSPNRTGTFDEKMLTGDPIKTSALRIMLEFSSDDELLALRFVNVSFNNSVGHKN